MDRFLAFSLITQDSQAYGPTAEEALRNATTHLPDGDFIEVLDCGEAERSVYFWKNAIPLYHVRQRPGVTVVFRGAGFDNEQSHLPAVALWARRAWLG